MTWALFMFCSKCFAPGTETAQLIATVKEAVQKLFSFITRSDSTSSLLLICLLSLGKILHVHPPTENTQAFFKYLADLAVSKDHSEQIRWAALKCVFLTVKYT
jgi:hypothetical protein